jgi:hypothetical protein
MTNRSLFLEALLRDLESMSVMFARKMATLSNGKELVIRAQQLLASELLIHQLFIMENFTSLEAKMMTIRNLTTYGNLISLLRCIPKLS